MIEEFQIMSVLGEGTYGKVKLGQHKKNGWKVAIKILKKEKLKTRNDLMRVQRQVSILKILKHPHIIQLYQVKEDENNIWMIMQYAKQKDLASVLRERKSFSEKEVKPIIAQLGLAIHYMHSKGISHRDIKPANIFFTQHHTIKIGDFGLSNYFEKNSLLKTSCGSPSYAAPQLIAGKLYNPIKSDSWSIGIMMYELLQGTLPFLHQNIIQLYKLILKGQYQNLTCISSQGNLFLKQLLEVNPDKRLSSKDVVNHPYLVEQIQQRSRLKQFAFTRTKVESSTQRRQSVSQCIKYRSLIKNNMKGNNEDNVKGNNKDYVKGNKEDNVKGNNEDNVKGSNKLWRRKYEGKQNKRKLDVKENKSDANIGVMQTYIKQQSSHLIQAKTFKFGYIRISHEIPFKERIINQQLVIESARKQKRVLASFNLSHQSFQSINL